MKDECLFCSIATDPSKLVWENDQYAAFKDINPKSKTHLLVVPKHHIDSFDDLPPEDAPGITKAIQAVVKEQGIAGAYRIQVNVGAAGGQEVDHLHVHILAN